MLKPDPRTRSFVTTPGALIGLLAFILVTLMAATPISSLKFQGDANANGNSLTNAATISATNIYCNNLSATNGVSGPVATTNLVGTVTNNVSAPSVTSPAFTGNAWALTNFPTLNQNTTGSAGSVALANINGAGTGVLSAAANAVNSANGFTTTTNMQAQGYAILSGSNTFTGNNTFSGTANSFGGFVSFPSAGIIIGTNVETRAGTGNTLTLTTTTNSTPTFPAGTGTLLYQSSITAGSNITVTNSGANVVISSSGASSGLGLPSVQRFSGTGTLAFTVTSASSSNIQIFETGTGSSAATSTTTYTLPNGSFDGQMIFYNFEAGLQNKINVNFNGGGNCAPIVYGGGYGINYTTTYSFRYWLSWDNAVGKWILGTTQ
jgi:hypothetical protein